jgi:hypothetical protein
MCECLAVARYVPRRSDGKRRLMFKQRTGQGSHLKTVTLYLILSYVNYLPAYRDCVAPPFRVQCLPLVSEAKSRRLLSGLTLAAWR